MSIIIDGSNSGTALSDTATQTLSNKTLASPVITGTPTINGVDASCSSGTWTPVVVGTVSTGTCTYSVQQGTYAKFGKIVCVTSYIAYTSHTGTGNIRITGLPYTCASNSYSVGTILAGYLAFSGQLVPVVNASTSYMDLLASVTNITWPAIAMDSSAEFLITATYITA